MPTKLADGLGLRDALLKAFETCCLNLLQKLFVRDKPLKMVPPLQQHFQGAVSAGLG